MPSGGFVGTFDPRLDSQRDVNYTDAAIEVGDYVANPDHKSIPVREVPEHYWRCLVYHEDRHIGGLLNPYGIDLVGVLKIPLRPAAFDRAQAAEPRRRRLDAADAVRARDLRYAAERRRRRPPPSSAQVPEWWMAPGHLPRADARGRRDPAQAMGRQPYLAGAADGRRAAAWRRDDGRVVFGKEAKDLTTAEQFVLASAVNKPIILLDGSEQLNEVRLDRWRYIAEVRARICADKLIADEAEQRRVIFELVNLAGGPPDPHVKPKLQKALEALCAGARPACARQPRCSAPTR